MYRLIRYSYFTLGVSLILGLIVLANYTAQ